MLNRAPLFVNGFSFGGTNMIMNFLVSHPGVCMLSGETHEVFYSKPRRKGDMLLRRALYLPLQMAGGRELMARLSLAPRPDSLSPLMMRYTDALLYLDKVTNPRNPEKSEGVPYARDEIRDARFLAKSVNGVVLASSVFAHIYPDATFFALVRNGYALCEGYIRRGWSAREFALMYDTVCRRMIEDAERISNYHIVRFEDMVRSPRAFMEDLYQRAGLDIAEVARVRLQAKRVTQGDGSRDYTFGGSRDRETRWFDLGEMDRYISKDVDDNQISQLSEADIETVRSLAGPTIERLGYEGA